MSNSDRKYRCVVETSRGVREIISVKERENGDLLIFINKNDHSGFLNNSLNDLGHPVSRVRPDNIIREKHVSIHRLTKLFGIKIATNEATANHIIRHSTLVEGFDVTSVYPVLIRISGKLAQKNFDHNCTPQDVVCNCGKLSDVDDTLCFYLLVAGKKFDESLINVPNYTMNCQTFRFFKVIVGCCRLALRGMNFGKQLSTMSISSQVNGKNFQVVPTKSERPMKYQDVVGFIKVQTQQLFRETMRSLNIRNSIFRELGEFDDIEILKMLP